jgi:TRIAD3 protein (E3 ubiquitin-protein ligase RNF216)
MVQCPDGHLFCKACVFAFCKERLGQLNARIKCMDSQTDCQLEFMTAQLQLCLPPRLLALYERVKQADEISAAGLENLEECPFCEYKCVIDNENERLFHCVNEDCGILSCRGCKKKVRICLAKPRFLTTLCRIIYLKLVPVCIPSTKDNR